MLGRTFARSKGGISVRTVSLRDRGSHFFDGGSVLLLELEAIAESCQENQTPRHP